MFHMFQWCPRCCFLQLWAPWGCAVSAVLDPKGSLSIYNMHKAKTNVDAEMTISGAQSVSSQLFSSWSDNYCIHFVWHPPLNVACQWPSNSSWGHVSTAWKTLGAWWCRVLLSCRHKTCCLIVNVCPANCQWLQRLVCAWPSEDLGILCQKNHLKKHTRFFLTKLLTCYQLPYLWKPCNAVLFTVAKQEIKTNPNRGGSLAKLDSSAQLLSLPLPSTKRPDFFRGNRRYLKSINWKGFFMQLKNKATWQKTFKKKQSLMSVT